MQAWSAAALPFMMTTLLDLEIDGFERRIIVRRPMLPPGVQRLRLADLEACGERITLEVMAAEDGSATVAISGAAWSLQHDEHAPGV